MHAVQHEESNWWDAADKANAIHQQMIEAQVDLWDAYDVVKEKQARYQQLRQKWEQAEVVQETEFHKWMDEALGIPPVTHSEAQETALLIPPVSLDVHRQEQSGQGMIEYALLLTLIALVVLVALMFLGPAIGNFFSGITAGL